MAISAHAETANPRDGRFLRAGSRRREVADTGAVMGMLGKYAFLRKLSLENGNKPKTKEVCIFAIFSILKFAKMQIMPV